MQASSLRQCGDVARATQLAAEVAPGGSSRASSFRRRRTGGGQASCQLGQAGAGEALLKSCVEIYGDDPEVLQGGETDQRPGHPRWRQGGGRA